MIRPLTFLSLMAAAGAGLHLYGVKHEVSQLEKTLRETVKQTELARERTAVLRAEWALLNEPERLRAAATRNLPLEVMQTAQFVRPADLDRRLPAAVAFAGAPSLFGPGSRADASVASAGPAPAQAAAGATVPAPVASATPMAAVLAAAASAAARVAHSAMTPAAQAAQNASVSVVPLPVPPRSPAAARPSTERLPERTERTPVVVVERVPAAPASRPAPAAPERAPAPIERVTLPPAPVSPPRPTQMAAVLPAPPRAAEAPKAPRAARAGDQPGELDRGMNLAAPPQPPALLRTALHMRPPAQPSAQPRVMAQAMAPRSGEATSALGSVFGTGRPSLAPPVPVASASAATLDRGR